MLNRADARSAGLRKFVGNPCHRRHDGVRYVSDGKCVACGAEKGAKKWVMHREKMSRAAREWREKNKARHLENFRRWRGANADADRASSRLWQQENPAKVIAAIAKYKAAKLQAMPAWVDVAAIDQIYQERQRISETNGPHHVDHIVPLQGKLVCGLHVPWNLQIIPEDDNRRKSNIFHG